MNDRLEIVAATQTALALGADGTPPRRVKLLPMGEIIMRDGRGPYRLSDQAHAEQVVAATRRFLGNVDFQFDYDHQAVFGARAGTGGTAPASGWVKAGDISAESDGIYANNIEWTPAGSAALVSREYRYVSPVFLADQAGRVQRLSNAALVNSPAIDLPPIAAGQQSEQEEIAAMAIITPEIMDALFSRSYSRGASVGFVGGS